MIVDGTLGGVVEHVGRYAGSHGSRAPGTPFLRQEEGQGYGVLPQDAEGVGAHRVSPWRK